MFAVDLTSDCRHEEVDIVAGALQPNPSHATSWNTASLVVNGVKQMLTSDNSFGDALLPDASAGQFIPHLYSDQGFADGPHSDFHAPHWYPADVPPTDPLHGAAEIFIPPWSLGINGNPIGIPNSTGEAGVKVHYRDVQVWSGQYIDPVANYGKFITLTNGGANGIPVKPSIAAASFGLPTYLFTGGANRAATNGGTGGPFTKVGIIKDATLGGF